MPRVLVDGQELDVTAGRTVLDVLAEREVVVPALCHDPRLEPSGACRLCVVAVDDPHTGEPALVVACTTRVYDGMRISTDTPAVQAQRRAVLSMLARDYPADAAAAQPDRLFHQLLEAFGIRAQGAVGEHVDISHPTIQVDLSQCISCFRCVRICEQVQGQFVWKITGRGHDTQVVPDSFGAFGDSSCVSCGACVDTCPTGALTDRSILEGSPPTAWTRSVCGYCGVGCELQIGTRNGRVVQVAPARDAPANRGHACVKGRYGHGFTSAADRLHHPQVRRDGVWHELNWDEAAALVANGLRRVVEEHGPSTVGVLASARATNEESYVLQKFARAVLGTNNVDCCARVCHSPSAAAMGEMLGTGAATSSYDDIERTRAILVVGSNTTESHPVVGARIKQAALAGATLIVIDPRRIELATYATFHLRPRPGTNVLLLNALASVIVEERLVDEDFLSERVAGMAEYQRFVADYRPERVTAECGVPAELIRAAARGYATAGPAMCFHGLGVTEHEQGVDGVRCLVNLALLTGNLGRPGAGVNPLRGQNNVQGSAHMGCEPAHLPGYAPLAAASEHVAAVWGAPIPQQPGLDAMQMLDAAATGRLKALWVVGWDLLLTQPQRAQTRRSLAALDLLIVQDLFLNETAADLATVLLPAASVFEKDGTFMSSERRVQRVRKALDPPGSAKPDWQITALVAAAMGRAELFPYTTAEQIWDEVRRVWTAGAGISYQRLDTLGGLQWPCPHEQHPGTPLLHTTTFPGLGPRATLQPIPYRRAGEQTSPDYPLTLVTGRSLYQFNAGTMSRRSATARFRDTDVLEISPQDADRLGLASGQPVRVTSRYGQAVLPARISDRVPVGLVFATFSDPAVSLNNVTGPHRDPTTHTPAYKITAVRLERQPANLP